MQSRLTWFEVDEIRVREDGGAFRVIYVAKFSEAIYIAACFPEEGAQDGEAGHRACAAAFQGIGAGEKTAMSRKLKITRGSGNVFADIGFDKGEAENLKLRAELMMRIEDCFRKSGAPQAAMAEALGLATPRFNALLNIATCAGLSVRLLVKKAA